MIIGVVVCVVLFALAYQTLVPGRIIDSSAGRPDPEPVEAVRSEQEQVLGLVTAIEPFTPRSITVMLLESGRSERFTMTDITTVQNRHGSTIGFGEVDLGQIVEVVFDADTREMAAISLSGRAWEQQNRSNLNINLEAATITIGNQVYTYSSRTLVLNQGQPFSISLINPEDILTLVGYEDKIWSIRIDSGHGFVRFDNADRVENGTVAVGNITFTALENSRSISVIEGVHRVIIDGQNIDTFVVDVVVRQGETVVVDLADVIFRSGTLQIIVNEPDATILLNGEPAMLENSLVELEFGTHILRVERPGFLPIQQEIELAQSFMRIEINLERDVQEAQILIETFPSESQIFVNGTLTGVSPVTIEVDFGPVSIIARRAGYEDRPLQITVDENSPRQYLMQLFQLPMHPPDLTQPPGGTDLPPPGQLPPLPSDWEPVPSPTIPSDWDEPSLPPPNSVWPPPPEDLPVPPNLFE